MYMKGKYSSIFINLIMICLITLISFNILKYLQDNKKIDNTVKADITFTAPLVGNEVYRTQAFRENGHNGVDYDQNPKPVTLYALADGTVTSTQDGCPNNGDGCGWTMGNHVIISVGEYSTQGKSGNLSYVYMHLTPSTLTVKEGDKVKKGQKLGIMGHSGRSTAPHFHVSMWISQSKNYDEPNLIDPAPLIPMMPQQSMVATKVEGTTFEGKSDGKDNSKDDSKESDDEEKKKAKFNPLLDREAKFIPTGLEDKKTGAVSNLIDKFSEKSLTAYDRLKPLMFIGSAILFVYITLVLILYLVFPIAGTGFEKVFEKLTSRDVMYTSENTRALLGAYALCVVIIIVVTSQYYLVLMGLLTDLIAKISENIQGIGGW